MRWKICWLAPLSPSTNNTIVTNHPENAVFSVFCLYWVIRKEPYWGCLGGCILFKKDVFDKIGLFDTSIKAGEVISLTMKMKESNLNIKKIDFVSSNRRIHDTNYGKVNKKNEFSDYASILRNKLRK